MRDHWEAVWTTNNPSTVSWFQAEPTRSLSIITGLGIGPDDPIIDVGGGASTLALHLASRGHRDLTVLDVSAASLALSAEMFDEHERAGRPQLICSDLLLWRPERRYALWHDRAVNHFLCATADRSTYVDIAADAVRPAGFLVLAAFAADGPASCSGLPVHRCEPEELSAELAPAFVTRRVEREHHVTPTGVIQAFHYLTVQRR